ncbi:GbsR/MarR family transcriptional regulator [Streptomyces griseocarneus]|uniref:GbsR/MarR family transcriptional regulator n=1 Tax=Streptomyces griseocarneus TaxID=51201 RepID=UPI00167DC529|nr:helix-turn-helix domain-containing protein [Streptomyces griseocarneus]MBZ6475058.1 helix-turn-helix domain-containing protein [Streptomyces griseocarneus]GHG62516.1 MarR family transcriptional regulator [Streptomyces griseocarneus]
MPGSRLTQQERRHIAAGLAGGLSYADIAKRLDRSTSTITREVMRNGGPIEYRADRAHHATGLRARRGRRSGTCVPPATTSTAASATATYGRDAGAVRDYDKRLTQVLVDLGLTRMAAGVLVCLYTTDSGSVTAADLVQRLRVSPASISKAVGYLEGQALIRRERDAGQRRDRYVIDEGVWYRSMLVSARLTAVLAETARDGAGLLGTETPAGDRLRNMGELLEHVGRDLLRSVEHWRHASFARQPPRTGDDSLTGVGPAAHGVSSVPDIARPPLLPAVVTPAGRP